MKLTIDEKTNLLLALFIAALVAANLLGNKITVILGISVAVGIFSYPITFLITDIIEEVHGKKKAQTFVLAGFISLILVLILTALSIYMPPASRFTYNQEYITVFSVSLRIIVASLIAFIISQTHDIWAFNLWKQKTHGKYLWLRNNASTVVSQFMDTTIFMFIAFYHVTPKFDAPFIFALIIPYWALKMVFALCDTPFVYLGVKWLKKSDKRNITSRLYK